MSANKNSKRKLDFDETSSEDVDEKDLCDDSEDDDAFDWLADDTEVCLVCGEFGKNELWYRCIMCSKWVHSECSGKDSPKYYICDFCA